MGKEIAFLELLQVLGLEPWVLRVGFSTWPSKPRRNRSRPSYRGLEIDFPKSSSYSLTPLSLMSPRSMCFPPQQRVYLSKWRMKNDKLWVQKGKSRFRLQNLFWLKSPHIFPDLNQIPPDHPLPFFESLTRSDLSLLTLGKYVFIWLIITTSNSQDGVQHQGVPF